MKSMFYIITFFLLLPFSEAFSKNGEVSCFEMIEGEGSYVLFENVNLGEISQEGITVNLNSKYPGTLFTKPMSARLYLAVEETNQYNLEINFGIKGNSTLAGMTILNEGTYTYLKVALNGPESEGFATIWCIR